MLPRPTEPRRQRETSFKSDECANDERANFYDINSLLFLNETVRKIFSFRMCVDMGKTEQKPQGCRFWEVSLLKNNKNHIRVELRLQRGLVLA